MPTVLLFPRFSEVLEVAVLLCIDVRVGGNKDEVDDDLIVEVAEVALCALF